MDAHLLLSLSVPPQPSCIDMAERQHSLHAHMTSLLGDMRFDLSVGKFERRPIGLTYQCPIAHTRASLSPLSQIQVPLTPSSSSLPSTPHPISRNSWIIPSTPLKLSSVSPLTRRNLFIISSHAFNARWERPNCLA